MDVRDDDFISRVKIVSTHDQSLWFTSAGRVHALPVYRVVEGGRATRGKPIVNLLGLKPGEKVQGLLALRDLNQPDLYVVTVTLRGVVKRTPLTAYANIRAGGIIALTLDEGDSLIAVHLVRDVEELLIATKNGMAIRFPVTEVRSMGRTARGVRGIGLRDGDEVVSASVLSGAPDLLTVTERGYGKRTAVEEYRPQGRGGLGLINLKVADKTGPVVAALPVESTDEIVVATRQGKVIRTPVEQDESNRISRMGRATQGVRLINLKGNDAIAAVAKVLHDEDDVDSMEDAEKPVGGEAPASGTTIADDSEE